MTSNFKLQTLHSEDTQRILKEQSDFVIPSEPKILRLVIMIGK